MKAKSSLVILALLGLAYTSTLKELDTSSIRVDEDQFNNEEDMSLSEMT